jgi:hypothetical protein
MLGPSMLQRVKSVPHALALVVFLIAASADGQVDITLTSEPGDFIGMGQTFQFDNSSGTYFGLGGSAFPGADIFWYSLYPPSSGPWFFVFAEGPVLNVGQYSNARRCTSFPPPVPCMDVSGQNRGCNMLTGTFEVRHLHRNSAGQIVSAWIVFEQHCEGAAPTLRGDIRINFQPAQDVPTLGRSGFLAFALLLGAIGALLTSRSLGA